MLERDCFVTREVRAPRPPARGRHRRRLRTIELADPLQLLPLAARGRGGDVSRLFDRYDAPALTGLFEEVGRARGAASQGLRPLRGGDRGRRRSSYPTCCCARSKAGQSHPAPRCLPATHHHRRAPAYRASGSAGARPARSPAGALGARGGPDRGIRARAPASAAAEPSRARRAAAGVPHRGAHRRRPRRRRRRQPAEVLPRCGDLPTARGSSSSSTGASRAASRPSAATWLRCPSRGQPRRGGLVRP